MEYSLILAEMVNHEHHNDRFRMARDIETEVQVACWPRQSAFEAILYALCEHRNLHDTRSAELLSLGVCRTRR